jgi:hypothetical protein
MNQSWAKVEKDDGSIWIDRIITRKDRNARKD